MNMSRQIYNMSRQVPDRCHCHHMNNEKGRSQFQKMKLSSITTFVCSLAVGGKLGFAKAAPGVWVEDGLISEVLLDQEETPETPVIPEDLDASFNCTFIEDLWNDDPETLMGTKFVEIREKCLDGSLKTPDDVAKAIEQVAAPNPSVDDQVAALADELCQLLSDGHADPDADVSEIEAACNAEPRDNDVIVDAASLLQAKMEPKDEATDAELEETCLSIAANRDKIEAALLVLAERSSARRLQDESGEEVTPVSSFEVATDVLGMYDCLCDKSNPDNQGCLRKTLTLTEKITEAVKEQASEDFLPDDILDGIEGIVETYNTHLRHSGRDKDEVDLSAERALSETSVGACNPPGISDTPHNGGKKLCLYAGKVFECELNWNPFDYGCITGECGAGATLQIKGSVQICLPGPKINIEIKLCISVISEILEAIGRWIPAVETVMNSFNIYSGCYRLAYASYEVDKQRLYVTIGPLMRLVPNTLNVFVKVGGTASFRFKGYDCAYLDDVKWLTYELAASTKSGTHFGVVDSPDIYMKWASWYQGVVGKTACPWRTDRWGIFQLYFGVELKWVFLRIDKRGTWMPWKWRYYLESSYTTVYSFEKYFLAKA